MLVHWSLKYFVLLKQLPKVLRQSPDNYHVTVTMCVRPSVSYKMYEITQSSSQPREQSDCVGPSEPKIFRLVVFNRLLHSPDMLKMYLSTIKDTKLWNAFLETGYYGK